MNCIEPEHHEWLSKEIDELFQWIQVKVAFTKCKDMFDLEDAFDGTINRRFKEPVADIVAIIRSIRLELSALGMPTDTCSLDTKYGS